MMKPKKIPAIYNRSGSVLFPILWMIGIAVTVSVAATILTIAFFFIVDEIAPDYFRPVEFVFSPITGLENAIKLSLIGPLAGQCFAARNIFLLMNDEAKEYMNEERRKFLMIVSGILFVIFFLIILRIEYFIQF